MKSSMTSSQWDEVDRLVELNGYANSPFKDKFISMLFKYSNPSSEYADKVIDKLVEEYRRRINVKMNEKYKPYIIASDLAAFVYCAASYSIKVTYDLSVVPDLEENIEEHHNSDIIEILLEYIRGPVPRRYKRILSPVEEKFYSDVLSSQIVYRARDKSAKVLFSKGREIAGSPDYVFQRSDGTQFHVDERHTRRSSLQQAWPNHKIQALAYLYALEEIKISCSYIVYLSWDNSKHRQAYGLPRVFRFDKSKHYHDELAEVYRAVKRLRSGEDMHFESNLINVSKCFACSVRYYCRHKSGLESRLSYPY